MASKQTDFKWRYQALLNSHISKVLEYINDPNLHPTISKNEMIVQALSAYYLPIAYQELEPGKLSIEQINSMGYESIFALQNQSRKIALQLGLKMSAIQTIEMEAIPPFKSSEKKSETGAGELDDCSLEENNNYNDLNINNFTISE